MNPKLGMVIFTAGWILLLGAMIINAVAFGLNLSSWYSFIGEIGEKGLLKSLLDQSFWSVLFLFIIYPLLLGLLTYASQNLFRKMIK
jgi:hypothetical protein